MKKREMFSLYYVVISHILVIDFLVLRDVIISCVYISNDILFVFMIAVATMDNNAEKANGYWSYERDWFCLEGWR